MTPHRPQDMMTGSQQMVLSTRIGSELESFRTANGCSHFAILYFLVAYVWGYAKACSWTTNQLKGYQDRAWDACERQERKAEDAKRVAL